MQLQKGQKVKFTDINANSPVVASCQVQSGLTIDVSCFGVNEANKLVDDRYMVFYNQKASPSNEITLNQQGNNYQFTINHLAIPANANKLIFTAAIDGQGTMSELAEIKFSIGDAQFTLTGKDFNQEKAIIVAEIYQKDGVWRVNAVGQGFSGGLDALLVSFGGEVAQAPVVAPVASKQKVFLEKRLNLEKSLATTAPKLLDLSKKAKISLEKRGLGEHRAKVALCLDISASMSSMYSSNLVQEFVERVLALGCRLDDDGSIDVFLFGANGHQPDPITVNDFNGYVNRIIRMHPLEYDTKYATAIELVRQHYTTYKYERAEPCKMEIPVYVMFLTDGQPSDKAQATRALKNASYEPIFWQFMGVGNADFSYLEKLDDLPNRYVDNADFFKISSLNVSDEQLYDKMMNEYPNWVKVAQQRNLLEQ